MLQRLAMFVAFTRSLCSSETNSFRTLYEEEGEKGRSTSALLKKAISSPKFEPVSSAAANEVLLC